MTQGPLQGTRVIEMGRFISAPYATMLLADLGAEVVKVEPVQSGDPFRSVGEGPMPPRFLAYNRNKSSIALDLRSEAGREVMLDLLGTAQVLVENFRPGVMARFGLDRERIKQANRGLVHCSITGAGVAGPLAGAPMYDAIGQALSGLTALLSTGGHPQPAGPAISDSITGLTAALATVAALVESNRTGEGTHVQTSLLQATTSFLAEPAAHWFQTGEEQDWLTRPSQSQSIGFTDIEGRPLVVHLSSPEKFWNRLLEVVERSDLAEDPRFATYPLRVANYLDLQQELQAVMCRRTRSEWLDALARADVPAAQVLTTSETFGHAQVQELGLEQTLAGGGGHRVVGPGATVGDWEPQLTQPPEHGADTERLLVDLNYTTDQIEHLRAQGVIR